MHALKARVVNGHLIMNEPTDLPEGTELELVPANEQHVLDDEVEAAWKAEARDRLARIESGEAELIPWEEAERRLLAL